MILFKMIGQGHIYEVNGCISTGKEANVYHATTQKPKVNNKSQQTSNEDENEDNGPEEMEERAVKVYKTSILVFKDRDRYVAGEFRFRHGYSKHNPRQMVSMWAEKEMRNLKRLQVAGIRCPTPIFLRQHVLLMSFIGKSGWAAPRLKDADLSESAVQSTYLEIVKIMRVMYHQCKLVHADLSEYNILYHRGHLVIIDVSQSVEHDHPHALQFLRQDCTNITDFYTKKGLMPMTVRQLFNFITSLNIKDEEVDDYLDKIQEGIENHTQTLSISDEIDEQVFMKSYIPRNLFEVKDIEKDIDKLEQGEKVLFLFYFIYFIY